MTTCKICNQTFDTPILLNKHLVYTHNTKPIEYHIEHSNVPQKILTMYENLKDKLNISNQNAK